MQYTIDTVANKTLVLMYAPATFSEYLVYAMDAYRSGVDCANNGDTVKASKNFAYADNAAKQALRLAQREQSKRRGSKKSCIGS